MRCTKCTNCLQSEIYSRTRLFQTLKGKRNWFDFAGVRYIRTFIKVGDYSLKVKKSAYNLFSVFISKLGFYSLQTRKSFGEIFSGNHRFLRPGIRLDKAWFPLSQLRPRQRPISSQNKAISMKDDCSTL